MPISAQCYNFAMPSLSLNFLGSFEAVLDGQQQLAFSTVKTQALLAYLMVEEAQRPGASHQRGALMTLLWPDTIPESAQTNLRQALYRLRQTLPEVRYPSGKTESFLLGDRQSVWVNPLADYRLDIAEFEQALKAAVLQSNEQRIVSLTQAASLYRGDFLADITIPDSEEFETWALQVRESTRRQVLEALEQISDQALAVGDYERAQEAARQQVAIDNLHESAYRQLMRALVMAGLRNEALAEFAQLDELLAAELGVKPANETKALAEAIRRGEYDREAALDQPVSLRPSSAERQAELILLDKVNRFWVEGVLDQSLHGVALIELGKETAPAALAYPWDMVLQQPDQASDPLPAALSMAQVFDQSGQALLILGEPGAGKTTMLLELARVKIAEARVLPEGPLPVVFNLTSWTDTRLSVADWLVEELNLKYLIPRRIGRAWVEAGRLLLLLDGLDEVRPEYQAECVTAINAFRQEYGLVPLAICSRAQDYQLLSEKLQLSEAIQLLPLDQGQAQSFLRQQGGGLKTVAGLLERDPDLATLAQSPLMLSIITLAYRQASAEDLASWKAAHNQRSHLFSTYVERMFGRRGKHEEFPPAQTTGYLSWLAQSLSQHGQSVFLLEQLQPDWLNSALNQWIYALSTRTIVSLLLALGFLIGAAPLALAGSDLPAIVASASTSLILGLILGAMVALRFQRQQASGREVGSQASFWLTLARIVFVGLFAYLATIIVFQLFGFSFERASGVGYGNALVYGLLFGLRGRDRSTGSDIRPVETIRWSWDGALRGSIPGLLIGVILGLLDQYITGTTRQNDVILIFAALGALLTGLVGGLRRGVVASKALPNEGLRLSLRYGLRVGLIFALASALVFGLIFGLGANQTIDFWSGWRISLRLGIMLGLLALLWYGGIEVLHHAVLRMLLQREDSIPRRYPAFLDHAVELIFLRRVGGGYIFVHQLLQNYFAQNF